MYERERGGYYVEESRGERQRRAGGGVRLTHILGDTC